MENEILNKPDYTRELVELLRSGGAAEIIAEELTNYHDNDIASALDELRALSYTWCGACIGNFCIS